MTHIAVTKVNSNNNLLLTVIIVGTILTWCYFFSLPTFILFHCYLILFFRSLPPPLIPQTLPSPFSRRRVYIVRSEPDGRRMERVGRARAVRRHPRGSGSRDHPGRPREPAQGRGTHGGASRASILVADACTGVCVHVRECVCACVARGPLGLASPRLAPPCLIP